MRLIDGDALYESLADLYKERGFNDREVHFSLKDMEMNINGAPAVEVVLNFTGVDVVRCKDCRHYEDNRCSQLEYFFHKEDDYCSWGERREDGKTG